MLMEHSFRRASELGYDTIVIFGSPANYVGRGFQCCMKYNICLEKMEKKYRPSQDEFYIMSHSYVEPDSAVDSRN